MKNKMSYYASAIGCMVVLLPLTTSNVNAATTGFETDGKVRVEASQTTTPLDPENPLTPVDPGESPSTEGDLRIDFVSAINFASAEITKTNRHYLSLAQLFHDETPARGTYVQVTDLRQGTPGWSLQLKQETQFKNGDNVELNGAVLSFDKGWANSGGTGQGPSVFRDTIALDAIGSSYQVASASKGAGNGTWLVSFGASETNQYNQENSLSVLKTSEGKEVVDKLFNKPSFTNSAVSLSVPDKTTILPGDYQTNLTWILQATP